MSLSIAIVRRLADLETLVKEQAVEIHEQANKIADLEEVASRKEKDRNRPDTDPTDDESIDDKTHKDESVRKKQKVVSATNLFAKKGSAGESSETRTSQVIRGRNTKVVQM